MLIMLYWDLILAGIDGFILGGHPLAPYAPFAAMRAPAPAPPPAEPRLTRIVKAGAGPEASAVKSLCALCLCGVISCCSVMIFC
jgi:hypothetical protein